MEKSMIGFDFEINGDSRTGQGLKRNSSPSESDYSSELTFFSFRCSAKNDPCCTGKSPDYHNLPQCLDVSWTPGKSAS